MLSSQMTDYFLKRLKYHTASRVAINQTFSLSQSLQLDSHTVTINKVWASDLSGFPVNSEKWKSSASGKKASEDLISTFLSGYHPGCEGIESAVWYSESAIYGIVWTNIKYPNVRLFQDVVMTPVAQSNSSGTEYQAYEILSGVSKPDVDTPMTTGTRIQDFVSPMAVFDPAVNKPIPGYTARIKAGQTVYDSVDLSEIEFTGKEHWWDDANNNYQFIYTPGIITFKAGKTPRSRSPMGKTETELCKYIKFTGFQYIGEYLDTTIDDLKKQSGSDVSKLSGQITQISGKVTSISGSLNDLSGRVSAAFGTGSKVIISNTNGITKSTVTIGGATLDTNPLSTKLATQKAVATAIAGKSISLVGQDAIKVSGDLDKTVYLKLDGNTLSQSGDGLKIAANYLSSYTPSGAGLFTIDDINAKGNIATTDVYLSGINYSTIQSLKRLSAAIDITMPEGNYLSAINPIGFGTLTIDTVSANFVYAGNINLLDQIITISSSLSSELISVKDELTEKIESVQAGYKAADNALSDRIDQKANINNPCFSGNVLVENNISGANVYSNGINLHDYDITSGSFKNGTLTLSSELSTIQITGFESDGDYLSAVNPSGTGLFTIDTISAKSDISGANIYSNGQQLQNVNVTFREEGQSSETQIKKPELRFYGNSCLKLFNSNGEVVARIGNNLNSSNFNNKDGITIGTVTHTYSNLIKSGYSPATNLGSGTNIFYYTTANLNVKPEGKIHFANTQTNIIVSAIIGKDQNILSTLTFGPITGNGDYNDANGNNLMVLNVSNFDQQPNITQGADGWCANIQLNGNYNSLKNIGNTDITFKINHNNGQQKTKQYNIDQKVFVVGDKTSIPNIGTPTFELNGNTKWCSGIEYISGGTLKSTYSGVTNLVNPAGKNSNNCTISASWFSTITKNIDIREKVSTYTFSNTYNDTPTLKTIYSSSVPNITTTMENINASSTSSNACTVKYNGTTKTYLLIDATNPPSATNTIQYFKDESKRLTLSSSLSRQIFSIWI